MKWHEYNYKQYIEQTIKRSPQQLIASFTNGENGHGFPMMKQRNIPYIMIWCALM